MNKPLLLPFQRLALCNLILLAGCGSTGGGSPRVAVNPMCTISAVGFSDNPKVDSALVSERTDPNTAHGHGFTRFRGISAPRGNSAVGFTPDVYGFSEAWSRNSAGPVVVRAQAHPARRAGSSDFEASAWTINVQDAAGAWSPPLGTFSANRNRAEVDTPEAGGATVPQLMTVGIATPQVFACAGLRSDDDAVRSTWLLEVPDVSTTTNTTAKINFIQDLLNGDDRFVPNAPGPLRGPATPPTPRITGVPGHPVREGAVKCAMTQFEDDAATRELHMLAIHNGALYHSMANNFGPTSGSVTFDRFRTVSPWGDVGQALGGGFGTILAAAVVGQPRFIHVLFVAESGGRHRLWHAVRFSAGGGSWRAAQDVFATMGAWPQGRNEPFRVAAGMCPTFDNPYESELVYAMWTTAFDIRSGRIVSQRRPWYPGYEGIYSPLSDLSRLISTSSDTSRNQRIDSMWITGRPFRDHARPPSP